MTSISNIRLSLIQQSTRQMQRALERLSTGQRVLRPKDDVASFSVLERLRTKINSLAQDVRNINSEMGLLQTADSAMGQQQEILQRMRELALQASQSTLSISERSSISEEIISLSKAFQEITNTTEFNGLKLLNGEAFAAFDIPATGLNELLREDVGSGNFSLESSQSTFTAGQLFDLADLNGDGRVDRVSVTKTSLIVQFGDGDGGFGPGQTLSAGGNINNDNLRFFDYDSNGFLDLLISTSNGINVIQNQGGGDFDSVINLGQGADAAFEVGDFDNDGEMDIVTYTGSIISSMTVRLGDGQGNFTTVDSEGLGDSATMLRAADLNGDGILDLMSSALGGSNRIFLGNGDGTFDQDSSVSGNNNNFRLADLNQDGFLDLVTLAGATTVRVYLNDTTGAFGSSVYTTGLSSLWGMDFGDVNSDGIVDMILSDDDFVSGIYVYLGLGDGTFESSVQISADDVFGVRLADLDGDGALDILATSSGASVYQVYLNQLENRSAQPYLLVQSPEDAQKLVTSLDGALEALTLRRAKLSAGMQARDFRRSYFTLQGEVSAGSYDQIASADLALEVAELVRLQILQQAQTTALIQANSQAALVLRLLTDY